MRAREITNNLWLFLTVAQMSAKITGKTLNCNNMLTKLSVDWSKSKHPDKSPYIYTYSKCQIMGTFRQNRTEPNRFRPWCIAKKQKNKKITMCYTESTFAFSARILIKSSYLVKLKENSLIYSFPQSPYGPRQQSRSRIYGNLYGRKA